MSEKRKPEYTILLKNHGKKKTHKIELFASKHWQKGGSVGGWRGGRFRVRFNGKWFPDSEMIFYTKTQIKEMVFKGIK